MSHIGLREILSLVSGRAAAIPAFNCYNMETVMGVLRAAEACRSPVILQGYSRLFRSDTGYYLTALVQAAARRAAVPVCFHLDHGSTMAEVTRALRWGCDSVMLDASHLPPEDNIAATRAAVELCGHAGVSVEGELGHVGSAADGVAEEYTDIATAVRFVRETGVAALAPQVGTAHGHYTSEPTPFIDLIRDLASATDVPLVLHGGSGIPDDRITDAIAAGIKKINFGTDLCCAFLDSVLATPRKTVAVDLFMVDAIDAVMRFAEKKIRLLGAAGLA